MSKATVKKICENQIDIATTQSRFGQMRIQPIDRRHGPYCPDVVDQKAHTNHIVLFGSLWNAKTNAVRPMTDVVCIAVCPACETIRVISEAAPSWKS